MTEGNGHVIDPGGVARRALQAAVAEHGPQALSNADIMDGVGRDSLAGLPGEAVLIGSAARMDVPALLRERIPLMGNYGAIQSVAAALSDARSLDLAGCVWVVREFARALGIIASGGTQPSPGTGAGSGTGAGAFTDQGDALPPAPAGPFGGAVGGGGGGPAARVGPPGRSRVPGRNVLGIAAAIALVAIYLGVAAVAHLSPFPAKAVASSSSTGSGQGNGVNPTPDASPDPAPDPDPDPSPPSAYQRLLNMIPADVQGQNNCSSTDTSVGATAVAECLKLQGLGAGTIVYYLFSSQGALSSGFNKFLTNVKFTKSSASCTNSNNVFADFVAQCEEGFNSASPTMTGVIAEYTNNDHAPIIVSGDNQQLVMAVMIGTNDADLLTYWKQLQWITTSG